MLIINLNTLMLAVFKINIEKNCFAHISTVRVPHRANRERPLQFGQI